MSFRVYFGNVPEVVEDITVDKWLQPRENPTLKRSLSAAVLAGSFFFQPVIAPAEDITVDKWIQPRDNPTLRAKTYEPFRGLFSFHSVPIPDTQADRWHPLIEQPYLVKTKIKNAGLRNLGTVPIDADAQLFITAAAITNVVQQGALHTLVTGLKQANIWTKFYAIYPFVGGTAAKHKFNLKNPVDSDAAFRLVFNGTGGTHSATGWLPNGTSDYADTFLDPSLVLSLDDAHLSFYSRTDTAAATRTEIGVSDASGSTRLQVKTSGPNLAFIIHCNSSATVSNSNSACYVIATRTSSTNTVAYKNGSSVSSTNTASVSRTTGTIFLGARRHHLGAANYQYSDRECAFASVGTSLTATEAAVLNTLVNQFQTILGRNVF